MQDDDELYFFAEIANTSDAAREAPLLNVELFSGDDSFGIERQSSEVAWVPPGASAFYQTSNLFSGSLLLGDWDTEVFRLEANPYSDVNRDDFTAVRIEGDGVYNDGTSPLGELYFREIVRDDAGIFAASCLGPYTGATIPVGKSVRAVGLGDLADPGGCGFSSAGEIASESLGTGGDFSAEHVLGSIHD